MSSESGKFCGTCSPAGRNSAERPPTLLPSHALGARVRVITRIGNNDYGREIVRRFREIGLPDSTVQVDETTPTELQRSLWKTTTCAFFDPGRCRVGSFAATAEAITLADAPDAICFGTLAQRTASARDAIQQIVAATPRDALRVFDINLRQQFYSREVIESSLVLANILKLNDDELPTLAAMFKLAGATRDQMEQLARMFRLQLVALTRGSNGSLLYQHSTKSDTCMMAGLRAAGTRARHATVPVGPIASPVP